jgi:hypothetical protein
VGCDVTAGGASAGSTTTVVKGCRRELELPEMESCGWQDSVVDDSMLASHGDPSEARMLLVILRSKEVEAISEPQDAASVGAGELIEVATDVTADVGTLPLMQPVKRLH